MASDPVLLISIATSSTSSEDSVPSTPAVTSPIPRGSNSHHNSDTSLSSSSHEEARCLLSVHRHLSVDSSSSGDDPNPGLTVRSACCSPSRSMPSSPQGPRFKLIHEGVVHVCRLNHTRTVISKLLSSRFLRRWEVHHVVLAESCITARNPSGFMEEPIPFRLIQDIYPVQRWDSCGRFCIRVVIPDGSLLLQVSNSYLRDQWFHSLLWKRATLRSHKLLTSCTRPEVLLKELKGLVELVLTTPLQDEEIFQTALDIISDVLLKGQTWMSRCVAEDVIISVSVLLERTTPTSGICDFFCWHCRQNPRSTVVLDICTPIVERILKHNMDFGKHPQTRAFVQEYLLAVNCQNSGNSVVRNFVNYMHGPSSTCPHPRVLPNLVAICVAAIFSVFENKKKRYVEIQNDASGINREWEAKVDCFVSLFTILSTFDDWRPSLAELLQPIPFHDDALTCERFTSSFKPVIEKICFDDRCGVHQMILGVRDEKGGWLHLYCPGGIACDDDGDLWSTMLDKLLTCCYRRRRFLQTLTKNIGPCMLRALRDDETCQKALCAMLEMEVVDSRDLQLQLITTLQSTPSGKQHYSALSQRQMHLRQLATDLGDDETCQKALCAMLEMEVVDSRDLQLQLITTLQSTPSGKQQYSALSQRQMHLRQLQQKGGPKKLALPSRSTDADVARLLSSGPFGDLECLSLAFTQVTSACAEELIKLPSLRYLNLWSTQFGDEGLQMISDHLPKLQVLNLCETKVTDEGLSCLTNLKNLRKLNLNSTSLSAQTFESLKHSLPVLQECDVRYTEAWGF